MVKEKTDVVCGPCERGNHDGCHVGRGHWVCICGLMDHHADFEVAR